jgi:hypothetical protein
MKTTLFEKSILQKQNRNPERGNTKEYRGILHMAAYSTFLSPSWSTFCSMI